MIVHIVENNKTLQESGKQEKEEKEEKLEKALKVFSQYIDIK